MRLVEESPTATWTVKVARTSRHAMRSSPSTSTRSPRGQAAKHARCRGVQAGRCRPAGARDVRAVRVLHRQYRLVGAARSQRHAPPRGVGPGDGGAVRLRLFGARERKLRRSAAAAADPARDAAAVPRASVTPDSTGSRRSTDSKSGAAQIAELLDQVPDLEAKQRDEALEFIDKFYEIVELARAGAREDRRRMPRRRVTSFRPRRVSPPPLDGQ